MINRHRGVLVGAASNVVKAESSAHRRSIPADGTCDEWPELNPFGSQGYDVEHEVVVILVLDSVPVSLFELGGLRCFIRVLVDSTHDATIYTIIRGLHAKGWMGFPDSRMLSLAMADFNRRLD